MSEVSYREQLLFEQVCKSAARLAKNYITAALTRAKIANPDFKIQIDKDVLAWRVARDYCLEHIRDDHLKILKFDSSVDMIVAFDKVRQNVSVNECQATFTEPSAGSQDDDEDLLRAEPEDRQIYRFAKLDLAATAPKMTFDIWALVSEEDMLRSINEELTVLNKNEEQSKINEATADVMANDQALTESTITLFHQTQMQVTSHLQLQWHLTQAAQLINKLETKLESLRRQQEENPKPIGSFIVHCR
jgi:hypothetical protein